MIYVLRNGDITTDSGYDMTSGKLANVEDINKIETQINEVKKCHHWISILTPDCKDFSYSLRFQKDLVEWLAAKKEEYQKEFDGI